MVAFPFKLSLHWLVIWPGQEWGTMTDVEFTKNFTPSNREARALMVGRG